MKNKRTVYFLLPVVVLIWGIILYRILSGINPDPVSVRTIKSAKTKTLKVDTTSYNLALNYRDPFLTRSNTKPLKPKPVRKNTSLKKTKPQKVAKESKTDWSQIKYFGIMQNPKNQKMMALMSIKGKYEYVEKRMEVGIFLVQSIHPDSVGLVANGETRYFSKK